ncbi:trypsin-like serine protease [Saccharothrix sp. NPDC042600]|uniref:trypsin-like serine protease n=1 Tax=Saccharothrix TaxID=2071 RepID=UPI0033FE4BDD|nr:hypothetical protein GCM10017745_51060 [Saccharothrix mutabilis subsp. capreolus]
MRRLSLVLGVCVGLGVVAVPVASGLPGTVVAQSLQTHVVRVVADGRACTGAVVGPQWVVTTGACVPEDPDTQPSVTVDGGGVVGVVSVARHGGRGLALLELATPAADVVPVA